MAYKEYLQRLLSPLGVYDLQEESVSGAMLAALGDELDAIWTQLQQTTRDAFPQTATDAALLAWEGIFPTHYIPDSLAERQQLLTFLLSREEVNCAASAIVDALAACGIEGSVDEITEAPRISVSLPALSLSSAQEGALKTMVRNLTPAHLQLSWHIGE